MQDASGGVFIGKVWPGFTAYPDFLNPKAIQYWQNEVSGLIWALAVLWEEATPSITTRKSGQANGREGGREGEREGKRERGGDKRR